MAEIPRISVQIRESNLVKDSLKVLRVIRPNWIEERNKNGIEIKSKMLTGGIMNKLIGFSLATEPKDIVILKVYGNNTDLMIDRQAEIDTMTLLHSKKCGPQLYAVFENGISYEFIHGVTLTMESCRAPEVYPIVAAEMARLHKTIPLETNAKSAIWDKFESFYELNVDVLNVNKSLANRLQSELGYSAEEIRRNVDEMKKLLEAQRMPIAFCHNDLLLGNAIYNNDEKKVSFIDYEYSMPNYTAFDVANHFCEFAGIDDVDFSRCPDSKFRSMWITEYLKHFGMNGFTQPEFEKWVDLCIPAAHLFWALWAVVQTHHSQIEFDYAGYVALRYGEYKRHIKAVSP